MATAPKFATINHQDASINRVQDHVAKVLDPLVASPLNGAVLVKNVVLARGETVVPHSLGRRPQGFEVVRTHSPKTTTGMRGLTLASPWVVFSAAESPQWQIDGNIAHVRGLLKSGLPTSATVATGLPRADCGTASQCRPALQGASWAGVQYAARMDVDSAGVLSLRTVYGSPSAVGADFLIIDMVYPTLDVNAAPSIGDLLDTQPEDLTKVIRLTSTAACTVDILFF